MKRTSFAFALITLLIISTSCQPKQVVPVQQGPATSVVHPEWIKSAVLYEVNIRQYTPEGTLNAFAEKLPKLKELGVDILWLMPVNPIGEVNRKGPLGSYYSVRDYKGINPEFGTMDDFKALVKKTHELGMYLIIDCVPNHSSWDNPLVTEHPDWYAKDSLGKMFSPWDWTDVVKFDYNQKPLREYMIETMKYWLTETKLDGFRYDVAHQVPVDFWNEVRPALQSVKPDVLMLAEAEQRPLHEKAMDMSYGWELHHIMNQVAQGKQNVSHIDAYFDRAARDYNTHDIRIYFTSNHDENSWNGTEWERMGKATNLMTVFTYTIPGMPLVYSGQESGSTKRLKFFEKDPIDWSDMSFATLYQQLDQLKHDNPALWNPGFGGNYTRLKTGNDNQVLAFKRETGTNSVVVVLNMSAQPVQVRLSPDAVTGKYSQWPAGIQTKPSKAPVDLGPWAYLIYTKK
ncbi:MAG: alpha-amylase family glycosyl hydrolase [Bacteroidales bacterium]|nr:alpha-amylase family glycosyl hydrolase [Bacteroidales bacterium]